jgi:hypothetical protein
MTSRSISMNDWIQRFALVQVTLLEFFLLSHFKTYVYTDEQFIGTCGHV